MDTESLRLKSEFTDLRKKAEELNRARWKLDEDLSKAKQDSMEKAVEYCLKSGLLARLQWAYESEYGGNSLNSLLNDKNHDRIEMSELFETDYHCAYDFSPTAKVRYDDHRLSLQFLDVPSMIAFCKEHQIKVNVSSVKKRIKNLHTEIEDSQKQIQNLDDMILSIKEII